jgi:hypothetical protein
MKLALLAFALIQDAPDFKLDMKKFDAYTVTFTVDTKIEASDGRNSDYKLTMSIRWESSKQEAGVISLDGFIQSFSARGTWRNQEFEVSGKKGADLKTKGAKLPATLTTACEKGFKVTVTDRGQVTPGAGLAELVDVFPIWDPSALVGLACPFDPKAGKVWEVKDATFEMMGAFSTKFEGALAKIEDGKATVGSHFKHKPVDNEVPIEGAMTVAGEGDAKVVFDTKAGKPVKGDFTAKVHVAQGGWKRDFTQSVTWEVTR